MNLSDIRFPRQLEANETVETIRIDSYYYKKEIDIFGLCSKEIFLEHHLESGYSLNIENE